MTSILCHFGFQNLLKSLFGQGVTVLVGMQLLSNALVELSLFIKSFALHAFNDELQWSLNELIY